MSLAIFDTESNTVVSRGLTSDIVDHLMYRKNWARFDRLKVIKDISDSDIIINSDFSISLKDGIEPEYLGLNY